MPFLPNEIVQFVLQLRTKLIVENMQNTRGGRKQIAEDARKDMLYRYYWKHEYTGMGNEHYSGPLLRNKMLKGKVRTYLDGRFNRKTWFLPRRGQVDYSRSFLHAATKRHRESGCHIGAFRCETCRYIEHGRQLAMCFDVNGINLCTDLDWDQGRFYTASAQTYGYMFVSAFEI